MTVFPVPTGLNRTMDGMLRNIRSVPRTHGAEPAIKPWALKK